MWRNKKIGILNVYIKVGDAYSFMFVFLVCLFLLTGLFDTMGSLLFFERLFSIKKEYQISFLFLFKWLISPSSSHDALNGSTYYCSESI